MSQFLVRYQIDSFEYSVLDNLFEDSQINHFEDWVYKGHSEVIRKKMTSKLNSEWITRNYLSVKMILSATTMLTSLEYAIEKNLQVTVPYLSYYSLITCCRAFLYTIPYNKWTNNKQFLTMEHSKIINNTTNFLKQLDKRFSDKLNGMLLHYKEWRELFSYKFPASGIDRYSDNQYTIEELIETCKIICELAQLSSEQLQKYLFKNCIEDLEDWTSIDNEFIQNCYVYNEILDSEDYYRVRYIQRKQPFPTSIYYTMTEGMVEDFFATWASESEEDDLYNPDANWQIIFPVP